MELTIAELAHAVGKSDNFVRQHIRRKHLTVQRHGRNVSILFKEAERWARDRGLPFAIPDRGPMITGSTRGRIARMTVLTWESDAESRNMFTLVRHRRKDSLGPWTASSDETWARTDVGCGLRLYTRDASLDFCYTFIDQIRNSGTLKIDNVEIQYSLVTVPRCHWAYRDLRPLAEASVCSPFSRNSAEITEYWCFDADLRRRWLDVLEALSGALSRPLRRLGFPLHRRSDRVGNLMIAGALDNVTCDLVCHRDQTLTLYVDGDDLQPNLYQTTVWASHSEDVVLRRTVSVISRQTRLKLPSDVDHIGFSIYRTDDGQCVDHMQVFLVMGISVNLMMNDQIPIRIEDRRGRQIHEINLSRKTNIYVGNKRNDSDFNGRIRSSWLDRRSHEQEEIARKEGNLVRFGPDQFDRAARHFIGLLRDYSGQYPIYLADPYFLSHSVGDEVKKLILDIFAATSNGHLRILCGEINDGGAKAWWSTYSDIVTSHVSCRAFVDHHKRRPGFHDRYLIMHGQEILFTNSLNGWRKAGVTFIRHLYGVYRAEVEQLWSMNLKSAQARLFVQEVD